MIMLSVWTAIDLKMYHHVVLLHPIFLSNDYFWRLGQYTFVLLD